MVTSLLFTATLVMLFFLLATARVLLNRMLRRGQPKSRGVGATMTEELHALMYPGKRIQLEQRRVELVLRDDEHDGAPQRHGIDLDNGTAIIQRPSEPGSH